MGNLLKIIPFICIGTAALASDTHDHGGPVSFDIAKDGFIYEAFEAAVPHTDLENCPAEFDADSYFCRLTRKGNNGSVFVFSYDGEQPLVAIRGYPLGEGQELRF